jgi:LuxR family maltose regulon positive regulatory protein
LELAGQYLLKSEELVEQTALTQYRLCLAQARIDDAKGNFDDAIEQLNEAERLYIRNPLPDIRPIPALKARIWIKQEKLTESLQWVHQNNLSSKDDLSYLREFEHMTLVRVLFLHYKKNKDESFIHQATELLELLRKAAEDGGRMGSVIEILVLQSLAHEALGNSESALTLLERALGIAEPEGYVRIFVDEGTPMARLLSEAAAHGIMPDYTGKLLSVLNAEERQQ